MKSTTKNNQQPWRMDVITRNSGILHLYATPTTTPKHYNSSSSITMKMSLAFVAALAATTETAAAFAPRSHSQFGRRPSRFFRQEEQSVAVSGRQRALQVVVNLDESEPRDIAALEEWASACGVQTVEGFQLTSEDGLDFSVMTSQDMLADSPVLFCPQALILSAQAAMEEIGRLKNAEQTLSLGSDAEHIPQFYLFLKILIEYQAGENSPWFPWLNSLPRQHSNGASMTAVCFECLPPLTGFLAKNEGMRCFQFFQALYDVEFLTEETKNDKELARWAYAIVYTRGFDTPDGDFRIVPMGDMFNHGTYPEAETRYDEEGNAYVYTIADVSAGSPLRMSYGDPTNPSFLLARYGFLDKSSPATFCKIMIIGPTQDLVDVGYDHSKMLFFKETGEVSQEVWDVLLYRNLESDPETQQAFYQAHINGDDETKQAIHSYYLSETVASLQDHVKSFLLQLEELQNKAASLDTIEHPRIPLILAHNEFVKETFLKVQSKLYEYA